jgi:hypothetical protein
MRTVLARRLFLVPGLLLTAANTLASGNETRNIDSANLSAAGIAAVVAIVRVTTESPLPDAICAGLKVQVVSAGSFEQAKLTLLGKFAVVGDTSRVKLVDCPALTGALDGARDMVKSKLWLGSAVKFTATECVIVAESLPTPTMLKLYACETALETVTEKGIPEFDGVVPAGVTTQFAGAPAPHVRLMVLLYPFTAVSVPLKTADKFTEEVNEELAIVSV